jgi:hypothetical protein
VVDKVGTMPRCFVAMVMNGTSTAGSIFGVAAAYFR